jgi:hypothetical protein
MRLSNVQSAVSKSLAVPFPTRMRSNVSKRFATPSASLSRVKKIQHQRAAEGFHDHRQHLRRHWLHVGPAFTSGASLVPHDSIDVRILMRGAFQLGSEGVPERMEYQLRSEPHADLEPGEIPAELRSQLPALKRKIGKDPSGAFDPSSLDQREQAVLNQPGMDRYLTFSGLSLRVPPIRMLLDDETGDAVDALNILPGPEAADLLKPHATVKRDQGKPMFSAVAWMGQVIRRSEDALELLGGPSIAIPAARLGAGKLVVGERAGSSGDEPLENEPLPVAVHGGVMPFRGLHWHPLWTLGVRMLDRFKGMHVAAFPERGGQLQDLVTESLGVVVGDVANAAVSNDLAE